MTDDNASPAKLAEHFFRHESTKMVASLSQAFGIKHFDLVEDMVQSALLEALQVWKTQGIPDSPAAWLYRVAKNRVLDALRRDTALHSKAAEIASSNDSGEHHHWDELLDESEIEDHQLRMIFACCHPELSADSAVPLSLKTLCGFSETEIAQAMLISRETVRKRIYRAKQILIEQNVSLEIPTARRLPQRLHYVHNVLYLMFNEGYSSTSHAKAIRSDMCEDAARLCFMLTNHPYCSTRTTFALLALMLFHASRFESRLDQGGAIVLLEDQDRQTWDRRMIYRANEFLNEAMKYGANSNYHLEAAIAMQHCRAARFEATDWSAIIELYDHLIRFNASSIYQLNRAVAIGQRDGPTAAIVILEQIQDDPVFKKIPFTRSDPRRPLS